MADKEYLALYTKNCLNCSHLVETGKIAYSKCHWTKGNNLCPAKDLAIVIVGKAKRYSDLVKKARSKRDAAKETSLMEFVSKQSAAFQSKFYDYLENDE